MKEDLQELRDGFRQRFDRAFAPMAMVIVSERYGELRPDLELASDELAGPMYSIREHGECTYVFGNPRFPGVLGPDDFLRWCLATVAEFRRIVATVKPVHPDERSDERGLMRMADEMEALAFLAFEIVKRDRRRGEAVTASQ